MHLLHDPFSVASAHTCESFPHQALLSIRNIRETRSAGRNTSYATLQIYGISVSNSSPSKFRPLYSHNNSAECLLPYGYDPAGHSLRLSLFYAGDIILEAHHGHNTDAYIPLPGIGTSGTRRYDIHSTIPNDLICESGSFSTSLLFMVIELTIRGSFWAAFTAIAYDEYPPA